MGKIIKIIKLGTYLESVIHVVTLGFGYRISKWIAVDLLGFKSCYCCERKQWLNRLTNKEYDGMCNQIKLF
jgi:hypothetical protein